MGVEPKQLNSRMFFGAETALTFPPVKKVTEDDVSAPEAMLAFITARDHRLMRRVNHWSAPKWIRLWMTCATRGGDGWIWYAMALTVWLLGGDQGPRVILACFLAAAVGIAVFLVLK